MDPDLENGQGEVQDNGQENLEQSTAAPEQVEEKRNPAWDEVLNILPQEFHNQVTPAFKKWDENFSKVQSQYAPYKPLVEKNVPFEQIDKAMQIAHLLNVNPQLVYQELHKQFGQQQSEQGPPEENDEEEDQELEEGEFDLTKDPRFVAQQEQLQQMQQYLQSQFEAQQQLELDRAIANEWKQLEATANGGQPFDEDIRTEIINRACWLADIEEQRTGKEVEPDLAKGYEHYQQFVSKVRNTRANNTAPDVLNGNGGVPSQKVDLKDSNNLQDHIIATLKAMNQGG